MRQDRSSLQRRVLAATSLSYVVVLLDASIVNVALKPIGDALGTPIAGLQWVVNAYTLAFASLLLSGGALGDRWGARRVYLAGLALFTLASALCGVAAGLDSLILARASQGVGAALLVPCSLTLINHAYPAAEQRARAIGTWMACGGVAMAAGPLLGGVLIDLFGWRSIFFVNVPLGLLGLWLTWRVPSDETPASARRLDLGGQCSAILALGALIAVLIEGPALGWTAPAILGGIGLSAAAAVLFLVIEVRHPQPMLPLSFFDNGIFSGSTAVSMASAFVFYGLLFVFSLYYQQARGYSPLRAGLAFLPLTVMVAAGGMVSSRLVETYGSRRTMCAAFALYVLGAVGMLRSTAVSPYWLALPPLLAIGLAAGIISPAATAPALGTVGKDRAGVAAALLHSARQSGAALGVAVFGALLAVLHPLQVAMRIALWAAVAVSLLAARVWWLALASRQRAIHPLRALSATQCPGASGETGPGRNSNQG